MAYTSMREIELCRKEIPFMGGLETRVVFAGVIASTIRALIECPLELIKVRRQVGAKWEMRSLYSGFTVTWMRTIGLMTTFFILVDTGVRYFPDIINQPFLGPFIKGGVCATVSWWIVWPFEVAKSQIQAGTPGPSKIWPRLFWIVKNGGVSSLMRGIVPGSSRSLIANGASMIVFAQCQEQRRAYEERKRDKEQKQKELESSKEEPQKEQGRSPPHSSP